MAFFKNYLGYLAIIVFVSAAASWAAAEDLCEQERQPLISKIKQFDGSDDQRRAILSEYHHRRQFVLEACDETRFQQYEKLFSKVQVPSAAPVVSLKDNFRPRQTVEIDEISYWRYPASSTTNK